MGKNVLIIGASGDIGIAVAEELAKEGFQLILHYHKNRKSIEQFKKHHCTCVLTEIQADLSTRSGVEILLTNLVFHVDSVVFASGTGHHGLFQDVTGHTIESMLFLHVKALLLITKDLLRTMIQKQSGHIIFITSIWGSVGSSHEVIYSTVKGAQDSFVKALAKEVAPCNISVNGVSPGFISTKMNDHLLPEEKESITSNIPMNRAGKPIEVAHIVAFLLGKKSSYIQGEIIQVTGGW